MSHTETLQEKVLDQLARNQKYCDEIQKMFSLFSNNTRFRILCVLREGDFCVNDIAEFVGGKHSNISQQLKMLTYAGYLTKERHERSMVYRLEDEKVKETLEYLCHLFRESEQ